MRSNTDGDPGNDEAVVTNLRVFSDVREVSLERRSISVLGEDPEFVRAKSEACVSFHAFFQCAEKALE